MEFWSCDKPWKPIFKYTSQSPKGYQYAVTYRNFIDQKRRRMITPEYIDDIKHEALKVPHTMDEEKATAIKVQKVSIQDFLQFYLWRWQIEVNIEEGKAIGVGEALVRNTKGKHSPFIIVCDITIKIRCYVNQLLWEYVRISEPPIYQ